MRRIWEYGYVSGCAVQHSATRVLGAMARCSRELDRTAHVSSIASGVDCTDCNARVARCPLGGLDAVAVQRTDHVIRHSDRQSEVGLWGQAGPRGI